MSDERIVKLQSGGAIKLSLSPNFDLFSLDNQDRIFLGELVDLLNRYQSPAHFPARIRPAQRTSQHDPTSTGPAKPKEERTTHPDPQTTAIQPKKRRKGVGFQ